MQAAQQGLNPQQMQQLLQQQQLLNSNQQQQVMQQQKLKEKLLHQLNEQLQLNILQQSQMLQQQQQNMSGVQSAAGLHNVVTTSDKSKSSKQMKQRIHELNIQQQQLMQQIQFQQHQFLLSQGGGLVQPFGVPQTAKSPTEIQQLWKEVASQSDIDGSADSKNHLNGMALAPSEAQTAAVAAAVTSASMTPLLQNSSYIPDGIPDSGHLLPGGLSGSFLSHSPVNIKQEHQVTTPSHPLFRHGVCKWPGCDTPTVDFPSFIKHLNWEHQLDDRSTAQARVQKQVVSQLEMQLTREKDLLKAMMQHLYMKPPVDKSDVIHHPALPKPPQQQQKHHYQQTQQQQNHHHQQTQQQQQALQQAHMDLAPQLTPMNPASDVPLLTMSTAATTCTSPQMVGPPRHGPPSPIQHSPPPSHQQQDSSSSSSGAGPIRRRVSSKFKLTISTGMQRNMENAFLSLEEIQKNSEFYRTTNVRPPFTYVSLIHQAIIESPHRQLTLSEIYKWFSNTFAYFRQNEATWKNVVRHNLSLQRCFMRVENFRGSLWTVDEVEFYKRRPLKLSGKLSMKNSNLSQDPSLIGDNLNASSGAALGENNLPLMSNGKLSSGPVDGVEDMFMKSPSSHCGHVNADSMSEEELLLSIKQEPPCNIESNSMSHHSSSMLQPSELAMLNSSSADSAGLMSASEAMMGGGCGGSGPLSNSHLVGGSSSSSLSTKGPVINHASNHSDMSSLLCPPTSNTALMCSTADRASNMCSPSSDWGGGTTSHTSDPCPPPSPTDSVEIIGAEDGKTARWRLTKCRPTRTSSLHYLHHRFHHHRRCRRFTPATTTPPTTSTFVVISITPTTSSTTTTTTARVF
ncbi:forkhead box protein P2 isoform X2 [Argonauta hians]